VLGRKDDSRDELDHGRSAVEAPLAVQSRNAEREVYDELCCYTLTHNDPSFIHQYVVDAFTAQHASSDTKPIGLAFALIGLYLAVEKDYSGTHVQRVHTLLARRRKQWPSFRLPESRGGITVREVMNVAPGPERDAMIRRWCASVWEAYHQSRQEVVNLLRAELG
jgi:hypothetical protein